MAQYPLRHVRVVDFSLVWVGPVISQLLGDMGAEVIKVESRRHLDIGRRLVMPGQTTPSRPHGFHRNKLGITLDLKTEEARSLLLRLVGVSDVVLENFPPRVMRGWGLTYEQFREVRPDIIMISVSAAGQWGPLRDMMTYGPAVAALSGIDVLAGYKDERPLGTQRDHTDPMSGAFGAFAILAALRYRNRTGKGQHIDLSQPEACATTLGYTMMDYVMNGRNGRPLGNKHRWAAPHGCYRCQGDDKWVAIAVTTEEEWHGLCRAMGNPEWSRDHKFGDTHKRKLSEEELDRYLEVWTSGLDQYDVMFRLQREGVPAAATLNTIQVRSDPHLLSRGVWASPPDNDPGVIPGVHWKLSRTSGGIYRAAPTLGRDRDYVFGELLGIAQGEIEALEEREVIY